VGAVLAAMQWEGQGWSLRDDTLPAYKHLCLPSNSMAVAVLSGRPGPEALVDNAELLPLLLPTDKDNELTWPCNKTNGCQ
jgi:hypothetical protein